MSSHKVKFNTEVEYNGERTSVVVNCTVTDGYREQEYPGAHVWHHGPSVDFDSIIVEETGKDIQTELPESRIKILANAAYEVMAWETNPTSEYTHEDEMEAREDARFEDMAYGDRDLD